MKHIKILKLAMDVVVVIVAAGSGRRILGNLPKQYRAYKGQPILAHTITAFIKHPLVDAVRVVVDPAHLELYKETIEYVDNKEKMLSVVHGGQTRQQSVYNGLQSLKTLQPSKVLIHDAARPFVSENLISKVILALKDSPAVDVAWAVTDTIKQKTSAQITTLDRTQLYHTQTPQGFDFKTILDLHANTQQESYTDDISLCIAQNIDVSCVEGEKSNIKITYSEDMPNEQTQTRVGFGYDVHRFTENANDAGVMICGVLVPHKHGIVAHSDGDVAIHALVDAILGALALGDIGDHFPPSDPKWRNADSALFIKHALSLLSQKRGGIINIDITIIAEAPRITPYKEQMRKRIAELTNTIPGQVSVKATTHEKLGSIGQGLGIAAHAVCTVSLPIWGGDHAAI